MPLSFDDSECPQPPASAPTDTLVDSVLILLGLNVVQRLVGFVRSILFCRWLDAEQLGLWDMAFSFLMLAAPLAVLAIPGVFGRYLEHYRQRGQMRMFLRRTMLACGGLGMAACVAAVLMRRWLADVVFGSAEHSNMIVLAAVSLSATIVYSFLIELFTALRNVRLASLMQLVNSVGFAVLGIGLLLFWRPTAESVLLSYGGSCLIAAIPAAFVLARIWRSAPTAPQDLPRGVLWARIAPFAAWVLLASVLANLFGVVDRYMLLHFSAMPTGQALDAVGNYYAARVVPLLIASIAGMLGTIITPHLSHDWEAGRRDVAIARLRLFLKVFSFALLAVGVVVLLAGPLMFNLGFRGKFPQGLAVLPWTLICCCWFGFALLAQNYLLCAERAGLASISLAAGLSTNVVLNLILLPRLGLEGAVLSAAAANGVTLLLICCFNARLGFRLDGGTRLALAMPLLLAFGPWPAAIGIVAVAACALGGDWLLSAGEKHRLAQELEKLGKRLGLKWRLTTKTL